MELTGRIKGDGNGGVVIPRSWVPWLIAIMLGVGGGGGWIGALKETKFAGGLDPSEEKKLDELLGYLQQLDRENDAVYSELHDLNIRFDAYTRAGYKAMDRVEALERGRNLRSER